MTTRTNDTRAESEGVKTPAHLAVFVDVLGVDGAMTLLLAAGGSEIYLPRKSGDRAFAAQVIGADKVEQLAAAFGYGYIKVPLARQWIAQTMRQRGDSDNVIARTVRADVATVRRWTLPDRPSPEQLTLPL